MPGLSAEIEREEFKIQLELKKLAKAGDLPSCKVLARSLVDSKRQRNRMHATKTQINSVSMNIQNQLGAWLARAWRLRHLLQLSAWLWHSPLVALPTV